MQAIPLDLDGPVLIHPAIIPDSRGYFVESFRKDWFNKNIASIEFTQENQSLTKAQGTVRGLHWQKPPQAQAKLITCLVGEIFDVCVDIRPHSLTFGAWRSVILSAENKAQFYIPDGFAHGFMTLCPDCLIAYKVSAPYSRDDELGLMADDPDIGIEWPLRLDKSLMSDKDRAQPSLKNFRQGVA